VSILCALFGLSKQAYYKKIETDGQKTLTFERAKRSVLDLRRQMPRLGTRIVITYSESHSVLIKVRDNGNGIPENIRQKIMQPFFTTKPIGEVTGLGLSFSYYIVVKGHSGNMDFNTRDGVYRVCYYAAGSMTRWSVLMEVRDEQLKVSY
jgi:nitrogen-specific signal transduction histidine kinase